MEELPRGYNVGEDAPQATAQWADLETFEGVGYRTGEIWYGRTENTVPFGYIDDRLVITACGSRGGKGITAVVPNLCDYPGSLICIDPKGENASITAGRRGPGSDYCEGMGQSVHVLDPFRAAHVPDELRGSFNPLDAIDPDGLDTIDDAAAIAEALVVPTRPEDAHWDESARNFVSALILLVLAEDPPEKRNLVRVRELLMRGDADIAQLYADEQRESDPDFTLEAGFAFDLLLTRMHECEAFDGVVSGAAEAIMHLGNNERGSILSTARRNTKFLESPGMGAVLASSSFSLDDLKDRPEGVSLYLCLPARRMESHSRWLRTIVTLALGHMERLGRSPANGHRILFLLDEFAVLGHVASLEKAAGFIAGYGVTLWIILQDLNQLKANYKDRWETFLGNAGVLQFFGNTDWTTLEYISKRLGQIELRRRTKGTSTSESRSQSDSFSESDSESWSVGDSVSDSGGWSESRDLGLLFSPRRSKGKSGGWSRGSTSGRTTGRTMGRTTGATSGTTAGTSTSEIIQLAPLMQPDEVGRFFARQTGRQILFISGYPPIILQRTAYFQDPYFLTKFDPHPDHMDKAPPTLAEIKEARRRRLEDKRKAEEVAAEEAAEAARVEEAAKKARRIMAWAIGAVGALLFYAFFWWTPTMAVSDVKLSGANVEIKKKVSGKSYALWLEGAVMNSSKAVLDWLEIEVDLVLCPNEGSDAGCRTLCSETFTIGTNIRPGKTERYSKWICDAQGSGYLKTPRPNVLDVGGAPPINFF